MRTTVQQKHTDGTIATLLRTALANRHDGNTKAYHQTLNTLRLAIEANIPNPEPAPPEEPEEPGLYITSGAPYFLLFRTAGGDWVRCTLEFGDDDDHSHSAPPIRQDGHTTTTSKGTTMKVTAPNETRQQKLKYLTDNGYLHNLRGELGMSTKTLSLLTKLPDDMFTALIPNDAKNGATGNVILPEDLVKAMRRGSKELQAKYNTTDMIDILYAEATK